MQQSEKEIKLYFFRILLDSMLWDTHNTEENKEEYAIS